MREEFIHLKIDHTNFGEKETEGGILKGRYLLYEKLKEKDSFDELRKFKEKEVTMFPMTLGIFLS